MMKSVPPLEEVFALAGMQLPDMLGKKIEEPAVIAEPEEMKAVIVEEPATAEGETEVAE